MREFATGSTTSSSVMEFTSVYHSTFVHTPELQVSNNGFKYTVAAQVVNIQDICCHQVHTTGVQITVVPTSASAEFHCFVRNDNEAVFSTTSTHTPSLYFVLGLHGTRYLCGHDAGDEPTVQLNITIHQ